MSKSLRDRIAMSAAFQSAFAVRLNNTRVCIRVIALEPAHQGWPEIEADIRVVIGERVRGGRVYVWHKSIRRIALGVNALIPIVKRRRTQFRFHHPGPGIFARRLIKVTVNNKRSHEPMKAQASNRYKARK